MRKCSIWEKNLLWYKNLVSRQSWIFFVIFVVLWWAKRFQLVKFSCWNILTYMYIYWVLITSQPLSCFIWRRLFLVSMFSKKIFTHFKWSLAHHHGLCSHKFLSYHDRALACLCGCHSELRSQTMISGRVLESMQWCPWQKHGWF